jgi:hypothetical protein
MASLAEFVEQPAMKALFDSTSGKLPVKKFKADLLVPSCGHSHSLVGTAADYLIRLNLHKACTARGIPVSRSLLVAEVAVERARLIARFRPYVDRWSRHVEFAKQMFEEFIKGEDVSSERIVGACQYLAKLDVLVRTGDMRPESLAINEAVSTELKEIWSTLDIQGLLNPRHHVVLNPAMVGNMGNLDGADADIVVDDTIVDIKTVLEPRVRRDFLRQLAGYAALAELGGFELSPSASGKARPRPVRNIAVLFPRYNEIRTFSISEVFPGEGWRCFVEGFAELARVPSSCVPVSAAFR